MSFRPSWDDYYLGITSKVQARATCDRGRAASIAVRDNSILETGYVGSPSGMPHCDDIGHQLKVIRHEDGTETTHCMRTVHAEQNTIARAARKGISLRGAEFYVSMVPCRTCAMLIAAVGASRVVAQRPYPGGAEGLDILAAMMIPVYIVDEAPIAFPEQR